MLGRVVRASQGANESFAMLTGLSEFLSAQSTAKRGDFDAAKRELKRVTEIVGFDVNLSALSQLQTAELARARGRYSEALQHTRAAAESSLNNGTLPFLKRLVLRKLLLHAVRTGDRDILSEARLDELKAIAKKLSDSEQEAAELSAVRWLARGAPSDLDFCHEFGDASALWQSWALEVRGDIAAAAKFACDSVDKLQHTDFETDARVQAGRLQLLLPEPDLNLSREHMDKALESIDQLAGEDEESLTNKSIRRDSALLHVSAPLCIASGDGVTAEGILRKLGRQAEYSVCDNLRMQLHVDTLDAHISLLQKLSFNERSRADEGLPLRAEISRILALNVKQPSEAPADAWPELRVSSWTPRRLASLTANAGKDTNVWPEYHVVQLDTMHILQ
ncbi:MAG: hypothetical protein MHM6MM_001433 [Cercozoa sp. M6MM]